MNALQRVCGEKRGNTGIPLEFPLEIHYEFMSLLWDGTNAQPGLGEGKKLIISFLFNWSNSFPHCLVFPGFLHLLNLSPYFIWEKCVSFELLNGDIESSYYVCWIGFWSQRCHIFSYTGISPKSKPMKHSQPLDKSICSLDLIWK